MKASVAAAVRINGVAHYAVYADGLYANDSVAGIAEMYPDERKSASNNNNRDSLWAFVWGMGTPTFSSSHRTTLLHEITHTLGGVQPGSPHGTNGGHCSDRYDVMCYDDGAMKAGQTVVQACATVQYDCNGEDYFNAAPAAGSYLASNWNVYDSNFLCAPASCVNGGPVNVAPELPIDESGPTSRAARAHGHRHEHAGHRSGQHADEGQDRGRPRRRGTAGRRPARAAPRGAGPPAPAVLRPGLRAPAGLALRRHAPRGGRSRAACAPGARRSSCGSTAAPAAATRVAHPPPSGVVLALEGRGASAGPRLLRR